MVINNNDLIEEAIKRRGLEIDKPFKIKFNQLDYAKLNDEEVFKISFINNEYVLHLVKEPKIKWSNICDFLFDNKNDIEFEFIDDECINPLEIKTRAEDIYKKYISLIREYNNDNPDKPIYFAVRHFLLDRRVEIITQLDILADILGYSVRKVENDIDNKDFNNREN